MNIQSVDLDKEQLKKVLPEKVYGILSNKGTYVFAALEEEKMLGIALIETSSRDEEFIIQYMSLLDSNDESILTQLVEHIENVCVETGCGKMVCRVSGNSEYMDMCDRVLSGLSYDVTFNKGHHMVYNLKTIKDTLFFNKLEQLKPIMAKVKCYNELDMKLLSQFRDKIKKTRIVSDNYAPDLVFAQYYISDGEIKGFMDIKEVEEGVLLLTDSYVEADIKDKYIAPAMIASAVKVTNSFLPDDSVLMLQTFTNNMYAGINACFGEPKIDEPIQEYRKTL